MTAEQQLERSVLEGKERDELHAIAQAMSLKTTSRTKKSDIIDRILEATGVPTPGGSNGHDGRRRNGPGPAAGRPTAPRRPTRPSRRRHADGGRRPPIPRRHRGPSSAADDAADGRRRHRAPAPAGDPGRTAPVATLETGERTRAAPARTCRVPEPTANGAGPPGRPVATQCPTATPAARAGQPSSRPADRRPVATVAAGNRGGRRRRPAASGAGGGERELQGGGTQESAYQGELVEVRGLLDLRDEGYGFLRCDGYLPSSKDVYVSISQARRFALRKGDYIEGACRPASNNEKYPALLRIDSVSGLDPEAAKDRPKFEDLTPLFPDSRLNLEMPGAKENVTARIVDLLAPIGKGQRGLIVSPPKAGKTTVMKQIAHSIEANNPEVHLMVLLVDERPEEVTDMRRSVKGEVVASTFDRPSDEHTTVAELAIERAKRLLEVGRDVVIILDGITRLARAYNLAAPATGRIMSGGVDSGALYPPKKFFGAARNIEEGGSLTILATALVETGSKMDEVIFEEFKGTGNMELRLDRKLAERRLYPSIDVNASSTRHEELLFDRGQLQQVWKLRRVLNALASDGNAASGLELLMDKIRTTKSNDEFLAEIAKGPTPNG